MIIKSAIRQMNVLNLLLLGAIYISVNTYLIPALREKTAILRTSSIVVPSRQAVVALPSFQPPPASDYLIVSDQNLFNPTRKMPTETKDMQLAEKPEFVLYGTLITDTTAVAYMEDRKAPRSSPGRGKRQHSVKLGTSLSSYTLAEIYPGKVLMVRGEDRIEVKISANRTSQGKITQKAVAPASKETKNIMSVLENKPVGSGLPPGIIHKEMPPELKDKVPSQAKDLFNSIIKERMAPK